MQVHGQRSGSGRRLWALVPHPEARLYVINDEEDYEELSSQFPKRWDDRTVSPALPPAPDWHAITNIVESPIDGVHVTGLAASSILVVGVERRIDALVEVVVCWRAGMRCKHWRALGAFQSDPLISPPSLTVVIELGPQPGAVHY